MGEKESEELVLLKDAARHYLDVMTPYPGVLTEAQLNSVAERLARLLPLLQRGGRMGGAGARWVFDDGREAVERSSPPRALRWTRCSR